jgi:hypothetical protein
MHLQGLAGKVAIQLPAYGLEAIVRCRNALSNHYIEEFPIAAFLPENEAGFSFGFAVDQDFNRTDGRSFSDSAKADRDPLHRLRAIENYRFAHNDG